MADKMLRPWQWVYAVYVQHIPIPVLTAWCNTRSLQTTGDCVLIGCYCSITFILQSPTAHDSGHYSRMRLHSRTAYALTIARQSISTVSWVASTREGPDCVGAGSTCMARRPSTTLINIYTRSKNYTMNNLWIPGTYSPSGLPMTNKMLQWIFNNLLCCY